MEASTGTRKLVGRERELEVVDDLLGKLPGASGRALYLVGEPGIGKTALLSETLERAAARGYQTLSGRAAQFERDLPFAAFAEALEQELTLPPAGDAERGLDQRHDLFRAGRARLEELAREAPVVLALDDVHWADQASIDLICFLLTRPPDSPVLLLLAARPHLTLLRLVAALEEAEREGSSQRLELAPLSAADSLALLGEDVERRLGERIYRESGGNPFYLEQLRTAAIQGVDATGPAARGEDEVVPRAVKAAIAAEIEGLSERGRLLLQGAAVAGDAIEPGLAASTSGLPEADALSALDELLSRDLIRPAEVSGRFRFRHPIVRRAVYESAGGGWKLAAHARAASALAARGASASVRAHHVEHSASPGDVDAVALLIEAGEESVTRAPASAAHWFDAALRLIVPTKDNYQRRLELLTQRAAALGVAGHLEEARDALRELLKLLPPEPTEIRRHAVAVAEVLEDVLGNHEECREMLLQEVSNLPDLSSPAAADFSTYLAINSFFRADWSGMSDWAGRALAAGSSGVGSEIAARSALALGEYGLGNLEVAERVTTEAAALFDRLSDAELAERNPGIAIWLAWSETCIERLDAAIGHLDRAIAVARSTGQRHLVPGMLGYQVQPLMTRGLLKRASENAGAVMDAAVLMATDSYRTLAVVLRGALELLSGDLYAAVRFGERGALGAEGPDIRSTVARSVLAEALLEIGEPDRCREQLLAPDGTPRLSRIPLYEAYGWLLLTRAELALGELDRAEACAANAEQIAKRFPLRGPTATARRAQAAVLLARGEPAEAASRAMEAVAAAELLGSPIIAGYARVLAGEALAAAGERAEAVSQLESAHAGLGEIGASRYQDRAAQLLRKLGQAVPRRDGARTNGALRGLSNRELEVLELVASGRTNRDIAAELYLSVRTVDRHVSRIFQKLGVSSRAAAASVFERSRQRSPS